MFFVTTAANYERQIVASYTSKDMAMLDSLLKSYYNTGLYPIDVLMYNYNELQGMEDWSVIVMSSAKSLIGKLILQRVLNEHRDKVLVCIETGGLDATICGNVIVEGITFMNLVLFIFVPFFCAASVVLSRPPRCLPRRKPLSAER